MSKPLPGIVATVTGPKDTTRPFADLIRLQRKALEITLHDLARTMEWTIPHLSQLERGVIAPPSDPTTLCELATALQLDLGVVLQAAEETAAACETARERVISAAVAYVDAWKDWEEHGGYGPTSTERQKHRELVAAVEGMEGKE
jgi:transcriptional regulator with XRE-family HTH domain